MVKGREKSGGTAGFHFRLVSCDTPHRISAQPKLNLNFGQIGKLYGLKGQAFARILAWLEGRKRGMGSLSADLTENVFGVSFFTLG
jgi:hypothetical protein